MNFIFEGIGFTTLVVVVPEENLDFRESADCQRLVELGKLGMLKDGYYRIVASDISMQSTYTAEMPYIVKILYWDGKEKTYFSDTFKFPPDIWFSFDC